MGQVESLNYLEVILKDKKKGQERDVNQRITKTFCALNKSFIIKKEVSQQTKTNVNLRPNQLA